MPCFLSDTFILNKNELNYLCKFLPTVYRYIQIDQKYKYINIEDSIGGSVGKMILLLWLEELIRNNIA